MNESNGPWLQGPEKLEVTHASQKFTIKNLEKSATDQLYLVWINLTPETTISIDVTDWVFTTVNKGFMLIPKSSDKVRYLFPEEIGDLVCGKYHIRITLLPGARIKEIEDIITEASDLDNPDLNIQWDIDTSVEVFEEEPEVVAEEENNGEEPVPVQLQRTRPPITSDMVLWELIRRTSFLLGYENIDNMITQVMCDSRKDNIYHGVSSYEQLKDLIDKIMLGECISKEIVDINYQRLLSGKKPTLFSQASQGLLNTKFSNFQDIYRHKRDDDLGSPREKYVPRYEFGTDLVREYVENTWQEEIYGLLVPYLKHVYNINKMPEPDSNECRGVLESRMACPLLIELIWSYWHEESMLVQTLNAISLRFQNKKWKSGTDPLERLNLNPLRRLSNLLWGYIQDEKNRLSVKRRAYEYDHHYGFTLDGKAVPPLQPADSRTNFTEAFHRLLYLCSIYFKEDDDTTVVADGFPVKNALREVHLILAEGAHNQYGDLPWTARREMLTEQWLLARPEMKTFLGGRVMVPYRESWMDIVDTMKKMQGWSDVSVEQYGILARRGEQILLSIRFGDWNIDEVSTDKASNWAIYWREDIQEYIHAYRAVTGVDLTDAAQVDGTPPSVHLVRRLAKQRKAM